MKLLFVFDSFKGTLTSAEAGKAGVSAARSLGVGASYIPSSDGGEGMTAAYAAAVKAEIIHAQVRGPLGGYIDAPFAVKDGVAVMETASAAGLCLIPAKKRDPLTASTFGVGELIKAALDRNVSDILLGLGGSATNDCGAGMAAALGVVFLTKKGKPFIPSGGTLGNVTHIELSGMDSRLASVKITACCDVRNILCGKSGASLVFSPQKGADEATAQLLEKNMRRFSALLTHTFGRKVCLIPGSGAAGGLGAAVSAFLGGMLEPGFDAVARLTGLESKIADADIVITGEGKTDTQTVNGKLPYGVVKLCARHGKPCYIISGRVDGGEDELIAAGASGVYGASDTPEVPNKAEAKELLSAKVAEVIKTF